MRSTRFTELIERMGRADAQRAYQVCLESIGKIETRSEEIEDPWGFTWKPRGYLASTEKDVPGLQAEYATRRAAGIDLDFISRRMSMRIVRFTDPLRCFQWWQRRLMSTS